MIVRRHLMLSLSCSRGRCSAGLHSVYLCKRARGPETDVLSDSARIFVCSGKARCTSASFWQHARVPESIVFSDSACVFVCSGKGRCTSASSWGGACWRRSCCGSWCATSRAIPRTCASATCRRATAASATRCCPWSPSPSCRSFYPSAPPSAGNSTGACDWLTALFCWHCCMSIACAMSSNWQRVCSDLHMQQQVH